MVKIKVQKYHVPDKSHYLLWGLITLPGVSSSFLECAIARAPLCLLKFFFLRVPCCQNLCVSPYVCPCAPPVPLTSAAWLPSSSFQFKGRAPTFCRCLSRTGIFHVLFALFFSTLTTTILQILSYPPHHTRSNPFRPLTQFTDKQKTRVLNP